MKDYKIQIITGIIILVVGGFFARYKIFEDKIELKYILSEKITSDLSNKSEEAIQQLTIKNSGDVLINSIVVKINSEIFKYQIQKFRFTDSVSASLTPSKLEITYPELPPEGEIIIILKSLNSGISKDKVKIFHSKGIAKEAFSNNESYTSIFLISIFVIYLLFALYGIRYSLIDSYTSKIDYSPYEGILKHKTPWYISSTKWDEIRKKAIENLFKHESLGIIEKCSFYQILNSDKKDFLTDDEWNSVINKAEETFLKNLSKKLSQNYYYSDSSELTNLKKPKNIRLDTWKSIRDQSSKAICFHKLTRVLNYPSAKTYLELLKFEKPEIANFDDWKDLMNIVSEAYSAFIISNGLRRYELDEYLESLDLEVLEDSEKSAIIVIFNVIQESKRLKEYYNELLNALKSVVFWEEEPEKPNITTMEDWDMILQIFKKNAHLNEVAQGKLKEAEDKLRKASNIEVDTLPLLDKVTKQLDIIDRILKEPETITKIEDYNIPFEKGNWENLLKVAKYLKEIK